MLAQLDGPYMGKAMMKQISLSDIVKTAHPSLKTAIADVRNFTTLADVDNFENKLQSYWETHPNPPKNKLDQLIKELTLLTQVRNSIAKRTGQSLTGAPTYAEIGRRGWFKKLIKNIGNDVNKVANAVKNAATAVAKTVEHTVALVGVAPARIAIFEMIKKNDLNLATMLAQAWQKDSGKVKNFWYAFGGDDKKLLDAINQGAGTHLSGDAYQFNVLGADPTQTSSPATPIVNAIIQFLRSMGIPIPQVLQDKIDDWINKGTKLLAQAQGAIATIETPPNAPPPNAGFYHKKTTFTISKPVLIGGAAVLGLILLSKN